MSLYVDFFTEHEFEIRKYERTIVDSYIAITTKGKVGVRFLKNASLQELEDRLELCNICINNILNFKKFCGGYKGGKAYFHKYFEQCFNSKDPCFAVIDRPLKMKSDIEQAINDRFSTPH